MTPVVVAPWAHTQDGDSVDPLNLVLDQVNAEGVYNDLCNAGWSQPRVFDNLYIHAGDRELIQDKQAVRSVLTSFQAAFGRLVHFKFPHPILRFHVRIWDFHSDTSLWRNGLPPKSYTSCASAHIEPLIGIHDPISFEQGEKFVARQLKRLGYGICFDDVPLGNDLQSPSNNGFATRVTGVKP